MAGPQRRPRWPGVCGGRDAADLARLFARTVGRDPDDPHRPALRRFYALLDACSRDGVDEAARATLDPAAWGGHLQSELGELADRLAWSLTGWGTLSLSAIARAFGEDARADKLAGPARFRAVFARFLVSLPEADLARWVALRRLDAAAARHAPTATCTGGWFAAALRAIPDQRLATDGPAAAQH